MPPGEPRHRLCSTQIYVGVFEETLKFIDNHRRCGEITGGLQPLTVEGFRVRMQCVCCGVVFDRWVTIEDAGHDLIHSNLLILPN